MDKEVFLSLGPVSRQEQDKGEYRGSSLYDTMES